MAWGTPSAIGATAAAANASVTPGLPTHSTGDALFLVGMARYSTTQATLATPSGYSLLKRHTASGISELCLWVKKATASESAPTITVSGGSGNGTVLAFMFAASGGDVDNLASIVDVTQTNSDGFADINIEVPAITPLTDNCLVLAVGGWNDDLGLSTYPTGYSGVGNVVSALGSDATLAVAYAIQTTAATISTANFAMSSGSAVSASFAISLKASGATPPTPTGWDTPAVGVASTAASGTTLSPALPTTWSVGDHLVAVLASRPTGDTWTAPAGWTIPTGGQYNGMAIALRVAEAGDTAPTFTRSGSSSAMAGFIFASTGGDTTLSSIVDTSATAGDGAASNDITVPALSAPSQDGCLLLAIGRWNDNLGGASFARPTWADGDIRTAEISTGSALTLTAAYKLQDTAASLSSDVFNNSGANTSLDYGWVLALKSETTTALPLRIVSADQTQIGQTMTLTVENASSSGNSVSIGGVLQTITAESATSITCSALSLGANRYGVQDVVVTRSDNETATLEITLIPAATAAYVDLAGTLVPTGNRPTSTADLAAGDQIEYSNPTNGTLAGCVIDPTGWAGMDPTNAALACSFDYRVHDGTGWGTSATITFNVPSYGASVAARPRAQRRARERRVLNLGR